MIFAATDANVIATVFLGIMASVMLAGVPWAFLVHGKMSAMNAEVHAMKERLENIEIPPTWFKEQVDDHGDRLRNHSERLEEHGRELANHGRLLERALTRKEDLE